MNSTSDYLIQLIPFNFIPAGGIIVIEYPPEYFVMDGSCISISGFPGSISCNNTTATRQIRLVGFDQLFTPSLLQFTIKGLKNQMPDGQTTTGSFKIYTKTSDDFTIDQKITGLNIVYTCDFPCLTCQADQGYCLSCIKDGAFKYLLDGKCLSKCPPGYSILDNKCIKCDPSCQTCADNDINKCLTCSPIYPNYLPDESKCLTQCSEGYYLNQSSRTCNRCISPCKTCSSETSCLSCNSGSLFYRSQNQCLTLCPNGITVISNNECVECDKNCKTCVTSTDKCTSCPTWLVLHNNKCLSDCPIAYTKIAGSCVQCGLNCLQCQGENKTCLQCADGFVSNNGICLARAESCDDGFYLSGGLCLSCEFRYPNCVDCKDGYCKKCSPGYFLENYKCVEKCSDGFYNYNNSCLPCDSVCKTCDEIPFKCSSCNEGFILYQNYCVNACPSKYYYNDGFCEKCPINCDQCIKSVCTICSDGFYNYNGICYVDCPLGYVKEGNYCKPTIREEFLYINFYPEFKYPKTLLSIMLLSIGYIFLFYYFKLASPITYYFGSIIPFISINLFVTNTLFAISAYTYGIQFIFGIIMLSYTMLFIINTTMLIIYCIYVIKDREYKYWISNSKIMTGLILFFTFAVDYKIIRIIYSRLYNIECFKTRFNDFKKIHKPYRILVVFDLVGRLLPLCTICVYTIVNTQIYYDIWYTAIETLIVAAMLMVIIIIDMTVNKDPNDDFFNQCKDRPEIVPYAYIHDKKVKPKINKRFSFDKQLNNQDNTVISSRFLIKKEEEPQNHDFSFDQIPKRNKLLIKPNPETFSKDDTEIIIRISDLTLKPSRLSKIHSLFTKLEPYHKPSPSKNKPKSFSNKIKTLLNKLSPKKHSYFQLNKL
jgi:hypothetical protein